MTLEDILLHQAGLVPFIPFYKETVDANGAPKQDFYRTKPEPGFGINVARNVYLRTDWKDTLFQRILASPVSPRVNMFTAITTLFFWRRLWKP